MEFRTIYKPLGVRLPVLSPGDPTVLVGSCFSENICGKMRRSLWNAVNPLGNLYNPLSVANGLDICLIEKNSSDKFSGTLFEYQSLYRSWLFDSLFTSSAADECHDIFRTRRDLLKANLDKGETLVVTFGTAWVYELKDNPGFIVGNCHKYPQENFVRRRLGLDEIISIWEVLLKKLRDRYVNLKVVFTVSPVRHLKDGFEGNKRSKAILLLAVEELCQKFDYCYYFPAYEIINDDLRDYRFYASDLVHPSEMAIEYIWENLQSLCMTKKDIEILREGERIIKFLSHRQINPDNKATAGKINIFEAYKRLKEHNPNLLALPVDNDSNKLVNFV